MILDSKLVTFQMGFLRQREDGTTSLAILTPSTGVLPGTREQPVSLGLLTGKLSHGSTQLQSIREDKKTFPRARNLTYILENCKVQLRSESNFIHLLAKSLNYGSFSSFAPTHDSTFAGLTSDEQELLQATYGDDTAVQYADR